MTTPSASHSQSLLPNPEILILDRIEQEPERFRLWVHVEQEPACPECQTVSHSRHSGYGRRLQDLPWQGMPVELWATVGRFRCRDAGCPRKIFCERLPRVARAYGRQTERASEIVRLIGYVAGGLPGQRLLERLSIAASGDTVLRRVRQQSPSESSASSIRILGVDEWAWRKGQTYGAILVDLEARRVVDLLPDRSAGSFSTWLKQYPEIAAIARDRSSLYAEGAAVGAPQAQQVADRFHLLMNLSATMERVLEERSRQLILPSEESPAEEPQQTTVDPGAGENAAPTAPLPPTSSQLRRQRRLERYEQVVALFQSGHSPAAISRELGIGRKTVRRWLRRGAFPEWKPPHRRPAKVSEFAEYLRQRWNEGCHNASRLYEEIREKGYCGKRGMAACFVAGWRKADTAASSKTSKACERISPKQAAILVTRSADQMKSEQQQLFERIAIPCPEVVDLRRMALDFRAALNADNSTLLQGWMEEAKQSRFGAVVRFANGLQRDISAVAAAVDTAWSTGQVEGQINRLKTIKRQMYGRAGFELLRARVLPYSPALTSQPPCLHQNRG